MHVKRIHEMVEKLTKCAEMEFEKGVENIDTKEMGEVLDMVKDLCEAEYYAKISKAMDEAEYGEDYDYMGAYDEHERKGYRGQPRSKTSGRFMSRGDGRRSNRSRGGRRGYEESMMYDEDMEEMERLRDMDRNIGRMSYSGGGMSGQSSGGNTGGQMSSRMQRDAKEGRSGEARRGYMESKEMNRDKGEKMKELENYMKELSSDVTEMITDMSPEEKTLMRTKIQTLAQKLS